MFKRGGWQYASTRCRFAWMDRLDLELLTFKQIIMNVFYIVGGVAIVFIVYLVFLQVMMKKRKEKQLAEFDKNHSNSSLTEEQKKILSFGAILFYARQEKILGIKPESRIELYIGGLKNEWGITSSQDAKDVLESLLNLQRSENIDSVIQQPSKELTNVQKSIAKGLGLDISIVEQTTSAYAWDVCRAVALAKWCYWAGYLTEEENWSVMKKAAGIAKEKGLNWTDYTISFLLGRTIQGLDLDDIIVESKQVLSGKGPSLRKIEDVDVFHRYSFK